MKFKKILLSTTSAFSVITLVTPIITSCAEKGISILDELRSSFCYTKNVGEEMLASDMVEEYFLLNQKSEEHKKNEIFKDDFAIDMSDAIHNKMYIEMRDVLSKYNLYFNENRLIIGANKINLNFILDIKTKSEYSISNFFYVKGLNLHLEVEFETPFTYSFVQKAETDAGEYDHTLLEFSLTNNFLEGGFNAKVLTKGSFQKKDIDGSKYEKKTYNEQHELDLLNIDMNDPLQVVFYEFVIKLFNPSITPKVGLRIECPYFRNINIVTPS